MVQRVLMVVANNPYPQDPRVQHEATALQGAGHEVTVLAPRRRGQARQEWLDGVRVLRFPSAIRRRGTISQVLDHLLAAVLAGACSIVLSVRPGFDVIHLHNPPDTLGFVGIAWQLTGRSFVWDHHDLAAEMYVARTGEDASPSVRRALVWLEGLCARRADWVIEANGAHLAYDIDRHGVVASRTTIVRNGPDTHRFPVPPTQEAPGHADRGYLVCFAGVVGAQDGVDHLVSAMDHLVHRMGRRDVRCAIVGGGEALEAARGQLVRLGLDDAFCLTGHLPYDDMVAWIADADVCVEPAPPNSYNDRCTTIKVMEYLAAGKPVVSYDLPETRVTGGEVVQYAEDATPESLARRIVELIDDPERRRSLGLEGRERAERCLDWRHQAPNVLEAYRSLADGGAR